MALVPKCLFSARRRISCSPLRVQEPVCCRLPGRQGPLTSAQKLSTEYRAVHARQNAPGEKCPRDKLEPFNYPHQSRVQRGTRPSKPLLHPPPFPFSFLSHYPWVWLSSSKSINLLPSVLFQIFTTSPSFLPLIFFFYCQRKLYDHTSLGLFLFDFILPTVFIYPLPSYLKLKTLSFFSISQVENPLLPPYLKLKTLILPDIFNTPSR